MPNAVKYGTTLPISASIQKGVVSIGVNGNLGPTGTTGWYNGITPQSGKYIIYQTNGSFAPRIYAPQNNDELIRIALQAGATSGDVLSETAILQWFATQSSYFVTNIDYPSIVADSLVLNLNPSCVASYPLGGGVWYDLVSGLSFLSYGSQTPFTTLGGASGFSFNGSGFWMSDSSATQVDMAGDCTLIMWIYNTVSPHDDRRTIFQKNGTIYASYEQEIAVTWEVSTALSWYSRVNDYDYAGTSAVNNGWTMMAIKMSSGKTTAVRSGYYSINGSVWSQTYVPRSTTPITTASNVVIGSGYAGTVSQGGIGMVLVYTKMLSDDEILQNFNATKATYGL